MSLKITNASTRITYFLLRNERTGIVEEHRKHSSSMFDKRAIFLVTLGVSTEEKHIGPGFENFPRCAMSRLVAARWRREERDGTPLRDTVLTFTVQRIAAKEYLRWFVNDCAANLPS